MTLLRKSETIIMMDSKVILKFQFAYSLSIMGLKDASASKNTFPNTKNILPSTKYLNIKYILPNTKYIHLNTRYTGIVI